MTAGNAGNAGNARKMAEAEAMRSAGEVTPTQAYEAGVAVGQFVSPRCVASSSGRRPGGSWWSWAFGLALGLAVAYPIGHVRGAEMESRWWRAVLDAMEANGTTPAEGGGRDRDNTRSQLTPPEPHPPRPSADARSGGASPGRAPAVSAAGVFFASPPSGRLPLPAASDACGVGATLRHALPVGVAAWATLARDGELTGSPALHAGGASADVGGCG